MFLPTYSRYFFILTDMWLLLVIKETYTRVKGVWGGKAQSYYTLQLLKHSFHSVKNKCFSTPALLQNQLGK